MDQFNLTQQELMIMGVIKIVKSHENLYTVLFRNGKLCHLTYLDGLLETMLVGSGNLYIEIHGDSFTIPQGMTYSEIGKQLRALLMYAQEHPEQIPSRFLLDDELVREFQQYKEA